MNSKEIDQKQVGKLKQDFISLCQRRFSRMEASLSPVQADKLKLLPLLFHVNHPMLPGYVDKFTPCGIPNYTPSHLDKQIAKTISQSFEYKPRAHLKYRISSLFLMGSMGTLGQSNSSDIDLWVCVDEVLEPKIKHKLQLKTEKIKTWFAEFGIELNSYIVHHQEFSLRKNKKMEGDNCGNTQNYLLLDEFYRTAVWFAGRWPLWWIIPNSEDYSSYSERLISQKHIDSSDWIDFGEVKSIPASEYFGAALWQLSKAIESPYKSSVKLLVLEVYAKLFPCAGVLSDAFKEQVYASKSEIIELDPYLLILKFAEEALVDNPQRLEFLRRAFYLKANIRVSLTRNKKNNWQYQTLKEIVESWNWSQARLDYLNSRHKWSIKTVKEERKNLVRELTHSYHFLSNFSRVHGVISRGAKSDLLTLGRKLYSAFERRSGKIEILNNGITKEVFESSITINQSHSNRWDIYIGHINLDQLAISNIIHSTQSLFEGLLWGCANGILSSRSQLHIFQNNDYPSLRMANEMLRDIESILASFSNCKKVNQFDSEAKPVKLGIFINTRTDPLADDKKKNLYQIASGSDCLSWAESKTNLASHFDVVMFNSWGEMTTKYYSGEFALIEFFSQHTQQISDKPGEIPVFCRNLVQKDLVISRVDELLTKWKSLLINSQRTQQAHRYVLAVSNKWQVIDLFHRKINYINYPSLPKLYNGLSENSYSEQPEVKIKFLIDPRVEFNAFLKAVLKRRFSENLDFFVFQKNHQTIEVIIRSTNGSIHFQSHKNINIKQVINHYQQFFEKIQNRNLLNNGLLETISYYQFVEATSKVGERIKAINPSFSEQFKEFSLVQAIATPRHVHAAGFDLYTANSCYLYSEHGEGVYLKLQKEVLSLRKAGGKYPLFLTDIDLSAIDEKVSIVKSLIHKKLIETKLNRS